MQYTPHTNCRCCGSARLTKYLDLGMMPLANNLQPTKDEALNVERYPLEVMLCEDCSLSQLSIVVDPAVMFSNYNYRSSINGGYKKHCHEMAMEFKDKYNLHTSETDFGSFVIDIAGNDGALLSEFHKVIPGLKSLNIDPASNLVSANEEAGVRQYTRFWSMETAVSLEALGWPKADVITATNVFAHVDNVREFLEAAKYALKDNGVLVLEFPYLIPFIKNYEWSTTYHEHLSIMSLRPLQRLAKDVGLIITDVKEFDIHCGTMRVTLQSWGTEFYFKQEFQEELIDYHEYASMVENTVMSFKLGVDFLRGSISAFAASAKGITLLNHCNYNDRIEYLIDQTPEKQGKFAPGCGLQVIDIDEAMKKPTDNIIILSWNFQKDIVAKLKDAGYNGRFWIPIPYFQEVF